MTNDRPSASVRFRLSLCLVAVVFFCLPAAWAIAEPLTGKPGQLHLGEMHTHAFFREVLAASIVGWVLGVVKGFAGTKDWLEQYWEHSPRPLTFVLDLVLFALVGAYFGTGIYDPASFQAAVAAGLSWPIGLGALATRDP